MTDLVFVLNGPNLNLLGSREPHHYGTQTLQQINAHLVDRARSSGADLAAFQSNSEVELIDRVQRARSEGIEIIIVNPAAFTHTSVALRDAFAAVGIPFIEVHLSNVFAREKFRHHSYFSDLALGVVSGMGAKGYELALDYALREAGD